MEQESKEVKSDTWLVQDSLGETEISDKKNDLYFLIFLSKFLY